MSLPVFVVGGKRCCCFAGVNLRMGGGNHGLLGQKKK